MPLQNLGVIQSKPLLIRCAQPDGGGLAALFDLGVRTIFRLNAEGEIGPDVERGLFHGQLILRALPPLVRLNAREQVYQILREVQAELDAGRAVAVHCSHGRDRTGEVAAAWRVVIQGWPVQEARDEWELFCGGFLQHAASAVFDAPDFEMLAAIARERAAERSAG